MRLFFVKIKAGIQLYNLYWIGSLILSIIIISSVLVGTIKTFVSPNEAQFFQIPVVVQAVEVANYSDGVEEFTFPGVELAIVKEVLSDSQTNSESEQSLVERVSLVEEQLQQPIPLATNPPETNEEVVNNLPTPLETGSLNVPTSTLTFSPSATTTRTNTLIATNTATFTRTATDILIPVTATSTRTYGPGNTPTFTPSPSIASTLTRTPTYTASPTWTRSVTASLTFTPTFTNSPTKTLTFTPTWTRSVTPSLTFTPTFTNSPTKTLTFTPTWTRSVTPSLTFTPTLTSSPTKTLTFTPTWTNSVTPSLTFTPTLTSSPTATFTFTPSQTATSTRTPSLTPTGSPPPTPSETICNINPNTELLKYMWPPDGSVNVPIDVLPVIAFDQSMDLQTLTYGDDRHIVICEKITESSNSCRSGTEIDAVIEIHSVYYQNDLVIIHPNELLENSIVYTIFAGNQIRALPECLSYSNPMSGREQINFTSVIE